MDTTLYIKIPQNVVVTKRTITFKDIAVMHCANKKVVQALEKEIFYTLPENAEQKTMFTIGKVYERIHRIYPGIPLENIGEKDFVVDWEKPDEKEKSKAFEYVKTTLVAVVVFFGAAFTIMTFNEDVSVGAVFDKVYELIMGREKEGASILELSYAIGLPLGSIIFYNHLKRKKIKDDPTPMQVEMHTYEEQVNKALIAESAREGKTIDVD